ncbi:MerR family transcriptional regulator [Stutzerimonas urumqiensis]|uniref:MerR family transcriptional regulator n=1 Tax=Stutzerimonas urumqiensis TaxID=638269 RepID=UPI003BAA5C17
MTAVNGAQPLAPHDLIDEELYPIREVARLTGVNPVTLRAWERRYGLIQPVRTPSGHRLYSRANIEAVRQILDWTERGVAISKVGSLLSRLEPAAPLAPATQMDNHSETADWQGHLRQATVRFDEAELDRLYGQLLNLYPLATVFLEVLLPAWKATLDQSGFGATSEWLFLDAFLRQRTFARLQLEQHRGHEPVLLATLPGQAREFESLAAGLLLCSETASVRVLPTEQPLDELALICGKLQPQALVLYSNHAFGPDFKRQLDRIAPAVDCPVALAGEACELAADLLAGSPIACLGPSGAGSAHRLAQFLTGHLDT